MPGAYRAVTIPELAALSPLKIGGDANREYFYALTAGQSAQFRKVSHPGSERNWIGDGDIAGLTANLIVGGVDTTSSTVTTFIFACCAFPEAQRNAHEEIDRAIGHER